MINKRLDAVETLCSSKAGRERLSDALSRARDLERLNGRLAYGNATPKDLLSISDTLAVIPEVKASLDGVQTALLKKSIPLCILSKRCNLSLTAHSTETA